MMDKTEQIISYAKDRYNEEQSRFAHIEDKCSKIVSVLTIAIAAFTGILSFYNQQLLNPRTPTDWTVVILIGLIYLYLLVSWHYSLLSLKLGEAPIAPKNKKNIEYLQSCEETDCFQHILDCYVDSTAAIERVIAEKARNLHLSYQSLYIAASIFSGTLLFILVKEILK